MATNIYRVTPAMASRTLPLRGDMAATLDFIPDDGFFFEFSIDATGNYEISSSTAPIRGFDGVKRPNFILSGDIGIFAKFVYDKTAQCWKITETNLVGKAGAATGGTTPVISAVATTLPPGSQATAVMSGPSATPTLTLGIPAGANGTNATPSGAALPPGGTTSQYLGKTGNADGQVGWLTLPTGTAAPGSGTGTGASDEVLLTQAADGSFTPDGLLGNRFRIMLTMPGVAKNPVNYTPGKDISIAIRFDDNGPYPITWGDAYAFKDRQPPKPPQQAGALFELIGRLTADIDPVHKGGWLSRITPDGAAYSPAVLGYGVPSLIARNTVTNVGYYALRSPTIPAAMTEALDGHTIKVLRNGLGTEAYGAFTGTGTKKLSGALPNGNRAELRTGDGVRTAFDRGILCATDSVNAVFQDLILSGAREQSGTSHIAHGVQCQNSGTTLIKNVRIYDCENGVGSGNADYTGLLSLEDVELDNNGYGDLGFTHNMYTGRHPQGVSLLRVTSKNCAHGHNLKHRDGSVTLKQVLSERCFEGRELNLPNGTNLLAENCIFHKYLGASTGQMIGIGEEGIELSRVHGYVFRNCRFISDYGSPGQDATFIINFDHVPMQFIDCEFIGDYCLSQQSTPSGGTFTGMVTVNGIRYWPDSPPVFTRTSPTAPLGPILPVGYQPIAVTPV